MPSVNLARKGVPISEFLAYVLNIKENHLKTLPSMKSWFNPKTNKVWQFGDIIKRPELAGLFICYFLILQRSVKWHLLSRSLV